MFRIFPFALMLLLPQCINGQSLTPEQWKADLVFLAKELPARHFNAFAQVSKADFQKQVADLDARIPSLSEGAVRAGFLKLVASIGDGHTNIGWGRAGAFRGIPLVFYWYKDGLSVMGATEPYRNLLGAKLLRAGKLSAEEACRRLAAYIPHENDAQWKLQMPNILIRFELLQEIGATDSNDKITLEFDKGPVDFEPAPFLETPKWIWAYVGEPPLYRRDPQTPYAFSQPQDGTVYFRYNQCVNDPKFPFRDFVEELKAQLGQPGVQRLIVDLRNNSGGNSAILDPWIGWLKSSPLNRKGNLFVLIGRPTFSSAILNAISLRNDTKAILVGEPTAGKANHFGEVRQFELPNSHARVSYSTKYFSASKQDTPSLLPDVEIEPSLADYLGGKDPVLAYVLSSPLH